MHPLLDEKRVPFIIISGAPNDREMLIDLYATVYNANIKIRQVGFEPGTHHRNEAIDKIESGSWKSEFPIVDIKHGANLSTTRWKKGQFRNQKFTKGWIESDDEIPGWGKTSDLVKSF